MNGIGISKLIITEINETIVKPTSSPSHLVIFPAIYKEPELTIVAIKTISGYIINVIFIIEIKVDYVMFGI